MQIAATIRSCLTFLALWIAGCTSKPAANPVGIANLGPQKFGATPGIQLAPTTSGVYGPTECSWILTTTGVSGVDPTFLINGASQTVTSGSGGETYPGAVQKLSINERTSIGTWMGPQDFFGFGIINGAQLSASDLTNLNTYMNNLMLGA